MVVSGKASMIKTKSLLLTRDTLDLAVTPKILFGLFQKNYLVLRGGYLKKIRKELSLSKYFLGQGFVFGFTQDLILVLEVLSVIWTQTKMPFTWEKWLLKISLKNALWPLK